MSDTGKVVVITGASMGIGEALAAAFSAEGAHVVLAARDRMLLEQVAARMPGDRTQVTTVPTDVTVQADVDRLVAHTLQIRGQVDVLINNAGVGMNGAVESLDLETWRRCLEINLLGAVRVIQGFMPAMKTAGSGTIVQISSVLGKFSVPYTAGYNASKHGLNAVSDALRLEFGIRVISVYPGSTESHFRANSLGEAKTPKVRVTRVPATRVAQRVVRAVKRGERDVYVTWQDWFFCWMAVRWPRLSDTLLGIAYRRTLK